MTGTERTALFMSTTTPCTEGLSLTKQLHQRLQKGSDAISPQELATHLKTLNRLFSQQDQAFKGLKRTLDDQKNRHIIEMDSLRSELHGELVDREANAARIVERQRLLFERSVAQPGQLHGHDRATASAAYVEAALVALCPYTVPPLSGCDTLMAADA